MPERSIITVSGEPGAGKSSVVTRLISRLPGYETFSAGQAFRGLAEERGMTVNELTALAGTDISMDRLVDARLQEFGKRADCAVVDSRMAWHFIPDSFKVYLDLSPETAAKRIMSGKGRGSVERYASVDEALAAVKSRSASERNRYRALYGVDIRDPANYDLVLDTSNITAAEAAAQVLSAYLAWRKGSPPQCGC